MLLAIKPFDAVTIQYDKQENMTLCLLCLWVGPLMTTTYLSLIVLEVDLIHVACR